MAIYRNVQTSFWTDVKIADDFNPEDRYFYLYLFTNPHTNLCGCYEVSVSQIATETGYDKKRVVNLIERLENIHDVIRYSKETKEVLILNWSKFNWTRSTDFRKSLLKEIERIKDDDFKNFLTQKADGLDTVLKPKRHPVETTDTNTVTVADPDNKTEERFNQFWELYPNKTGKVAAKKAWDKVKPNAELFDKIMKALQNNVDHNRQ